jgi:hypothetical protein
VAKQCLIQCGNNTIDRDILLGFGVLVEQFHSLKSTLTSGASLDDRPQNFDETENKLTESAVFPCYSIRDLFVLKGLIESEKPTTIYQLLRHTVMFKATKACDKIFALVGLASDVSNNIIDYDTPVADIQISLAKMWIQDQSNIGPVIFSSVDHEHHSEELPSWVPDWTCGGPFHTPLAGTYHQHKSEPNLTPNWHINSSNVSLPLIPIFPKYHSADVFKS